MQNVLVILIELCSFEFLLMSLNLHANISLLSEVNQIMTWLITKRGVGLRL